MLRTREDIAGAFEFIYPMVGDIGGWVDVWVSDGLGATRKALCGAVVTALEGGHAVIFIALSAMRVNLLNAWVLLTSSVVPSGCVANVRGLKSDLRC